MKEKITVDSILNALKEAVENNQPVSQEQWLNTAARLAILAEGIDDDLAQMEFQMAERERRALEEGEPAAKAKILRTGAVNYKQYLKLKAKRKRIDEHIRIAKKRERHPDY